MVKTLGGISWYARRSRIPPLSSSFRRVASVLLLKPFNARLNFMYLTGSVAQHKGIRISSVSLFLISFLGFAVSHISESAKAKDSGKATDIDMTEEMLENVLRFCKHISLTHSKCERRNKPVIVP